MCGLVGAITKAQNGFSRELCDAFDSLLYVDALRGMDSTGVFVIDRNGEVDIAKEASDASTYRTHADYKALINTAFQRGRALVGHNRAATKGVISDENAHPFTVDDRITLVHNGTLYGDYKKMAGKDVDVDSHAIAHVIHDCGDDVEKAMQQVQGAYALIWHDFKNNTLNFLRNSQRPLHFVELKTGWLWASEPSMLLFAMSRHNLEPVGSISALKEGVLTTYDFSNSSWKLSSKEIKLEATKSYTSYTTPPHGGYSTTRRHPYANGYMGDDYEGDDSYYGVAAPVCALPAPPSRPQVITGSVQSVHLTNEHRIAATAGINYPCPMFMNHNNGGKIHDKQFHVAECVDFIPIVKDNPAKGYFVYGVLVEDNNFLVKVIAPPQYTETDLLDMCLNNKRALFFVTGKTWRAYTNAADGLGYAMLNANSFRPIEETVETEDHVPYA